MNELVNRFIKYVKIDTQSDEYSNTAPTTSKQFNLANILVQELKELGVDDVELSDEAVIYARIKANSNEKIDKVAFVAHMDTSPDMSGENVNPRVIEKYDGNPIILNEKLNIVLDPNEFECLYKDIGSDLIVTDGSTLLGGDDKAGIAEIMTMVQYYMEHPEIKHGDIVILFTPDEEVGLGTENVDINKLNVDYAYTVDGGDANEINFENFNASSAEVIFHGLSIHPGDAKHKMINSQLIAMEFHNLLPIFDNPMYTEGYEGFNHLLDINGECEKTTMHYIIRNHDKTLLHKQENDFINAKNFINQKYGNNVCEVKIEDSYSNMREYIENKYEIITQVEEVMNDMGMEVKHTPIRGGTDGAKLTYMGIPCPNLGTGDRNCHGKYEYVSINEMDQISELLIRLVKKIAK